MKIRKNLLLLIAAAFLVSAAPVITTTPARAEKSHIIGSPYDNHRTSSSGKKSSDNIFKKSGRGIKKGAVKVKDGFVWTGRKIKGIFTRD